MQYARTKFHSDLSRTPPVRYCFSESTPGEWRRRSHTAISIFAFLGVKGRERASSRLIDLTERYHTPPPPR